jgi:hypothetical protein
VIDDVELHIVSRISQQQSGFVIPHLFENPGCVVIKAVFDLALQSAVARVGEVEREGALSAVCHSERKELGGVLTKLLISMTTTGQRSAGLANDEVLEDLHAIRCDGVVCHTSWGRKTHQIPCRRCRGLCGRC